MLILTVEAEAGDNILNTCTDMVRLSRLLNVKVKCVFNGITIMTRPNGIPEKGEYLYTEVLKTNPEIKYVSF